MNKLYAIAIATYILTLFMVLALLTTNSNLKSDIRALHTEMISMGQVTQLLSPPKL